MDRRERRCTCGHRAQREKSKLDPRATSFFVSPLSLEPAPSLALITSPQSTYPMRDIINTLEEPPNWGDSSIKKRTDGVPPARARSAAVAIKSPPHPLTPPPLSIQSLSKSRGGAHQQPYPLTVDHLPSTTFYVGPIPPAFTLHDLHQAVRGLSPRVAMFDLRTGIVQIEIPFDLNWQQVNDCKSGRPITMRQEAHFSRVSERTAYW